MAMNLRTKTYIAYREELELKILEDWETLEMQRRHVFGGNSILLGFGIGCEDLIGEKGKGERESEELGLGLCLEKARFD